MEYVITADRPFEQIEAQAIDALERQGFLVRRTFSLGSVSDGRDAPGPGYSVLMLYAAEGLGGPLALITLYERQEQTVICSLLIPPADRQSRPLSGGEDVGAELVVALALGGLEFCVDAGEGAGCMPMEKLGT
jgi:hypothetical protein